MVDHFRAGLADQDELDGFPSAASPLTAMGIDPDEARANPGLLEQLRWQSMGKPNVDQAVGTATAPPRAPAPMSRPTLGGMGVDISGALQRNAPSASATAAGAVGRTGETQPTDAEGYGLEGLGQLSASMKEAAKSAGEVPTNTPEDITSLSQRREKLAMPAPRFDPKTGKQLTATQEFDPETGQPITINPKASTVQKIWRGVRGGLIGAVTGGVPGALVGAIEPQDIAGGKAYNAPSKAYELAEQRREQALGVTDTSLENARKNWQEAVKAQQAKAGEFGKVAALGKDLTAGATGLINAENKPETEQKKVDAKLQLSQKEFEQRGSQADRLGLKGLQRSLYVANGKLPDPRQPTEGEVALGEATRAFIKEKGHAPQTLEEINAVASAARGGLDKGKAKTEPTEQQIQKILDAEKMGIEAANKEFAAGGDRDEYQRQLQEVQNGKEADMSLIGRAGAHNVVSVDDKGHVTWTPQAPAAPTAATSAAPAAPAAPVSAKPQPAPDGTRRQSPDGTIEVKRYGKWVKE